MRLCHILGRATVARRSHAPFVAGSIPAPSTINTEDKNMEDEKVYTAEDFSSGATKSEQISVSKDATPEEVKTEE